MDGETRRKLGKYGKSMGNPWEIHEKWMEKYGELGGFWAIPRFWALANHLEQDFLAGNRKPGNSEDLNRIQLL